MFIGLSGYTEILSRAEQETIHRNVLGVLGEVGLEVPHPKLWEPLAAFGGQVDRQARRVRFGRERVESFLAACPQVSWVGRRPSLSVRANCYLSRYHVPDTDRIEPLTEARLADYWRLAHALEHVDGCGLLSCPWPMPPALQPLNERLHGWKHGVEPAGIIYPTESGPAILDLCQTYAALKGRQLAEVFSGCVYLISPLKLGEEEAKQLVFFWERGLEVGVGCMNTGGTTAPVTLAGLVTITLAELLAVAMLRAALYGRYCFGVFMASTVADPRTLVRPFGAPGMVLANMMGAAMARFYGVPAAGNSGVTDAKLPSAEAGSQKLMATLATLLAGADAGLEAGLLSADEVISPVQLILDNELAGALRALLREYEVSDETVGLEAIREVGPGGVFTGHQHTARHFREELWEPTVWTRQMLPAWENAGRKLDADRALERYCEIMDTAPQVTSLSEEEERALRAVIARAESALVT